MANTQTWGVTVPSLKTILTCSAAFIALVAASKMSVQIGPVPLTMQTCAIGLIGAVLGARKGFLTVLAFVLAGLGGLPIFATPLSGPAALVGPTGGYLIAFPFGALIAGLLAERGWTGEKLVKSTIAQFLSNISIVVFGGLWLMLLTGSEKAFAVGLLPFFAPAMLKAVLAALLLAGVKLTLRK